jgi:predicted dehydrogenase
MKHLRIGGVGTGRIFQHAILPQYPKFIDRALLVGFYDIDPARALAARDRYEKILREWVKTHPELAGRIESNLAELKAYKSLDALLEQVDAVDIATHSRGRMPTAIQAFKRDLSAMAQKPIARTWTEADRAARVLAEHPKAIFQLNDDNAFEPKYRIIRSLIQRGEIGKVQLLTLLRGSALDSDNVLKKELTGLESGGGSLMAYGHHALAGALSLLGPDYRAKSVEAVKISVMFRHRIMQGEPTVLETDDNAQFKVLMEDKKTGSWSTIFIEATVCGGHIGLGEEKPGSQSGGFLQIVGDRGMIESKESTSFTIKHWNGGEEVVPLIEYPGETIAFQSEMDSFFDALREGRNPEFDIHFGAEIIAICGAVYLSAIRGEAVSLEQFKDYCGGFVAEHGDNERADDAIVLDLLKPYRRRE